MGDSLINFQQSVNAINVNIDVGRVSMNFMRMMGMGSVSPLGALVAGAIIGAAGVPIVRKGVRFLAVTTVGAALEASDRFKNAGGNVNQEWQNILNEARARKKDGGIPIREHLHEAGVGLAGAGLSMAQETREKFNGIKENIEGKMAGARELENTPPPGDYMAAGINDIDKNKNSGETL